MLLQIVLYSVIVGLLFIIGFVLYEYIASDYKNRLLYQGYLPRSIHQKLFWQYVSYWILIVTIVLIIQMLF